MSRGLRIILLLVDDGVGFDFDPHVRLEQGRDLDQGAGRHDVSEGLAMRPRDERCISNVSDVDHGTDDILNCSVGLCERGADNAESAQGLLVSVAVKMRPLCGGAGDMNLIADTYGA